MRREACERVKKRENTGNEKVSVGAFGSNFDEEKRKMKESASEVVDAEQENY